MGNRWLWRFGYVFGGLVVLVAVAAISVYALSERRIGTAYAINPKSIALPTDGAALARGEHVARAIGMCVECHGEQLQGKVVIDNPAMGRVSAPNLTRGTGGLGKNLTDADFVRAIRHGVAASGRALMIMPSEDYVHLSDDDLAAVIAYVKAAPSADNVVPQSGLGPVARALLVAGKLPVFAAERLDHGVANPKITPSGGTTEHGEYLVRVACAGCHGPVLAGGPMATGDPSWPPAANLTVSGSMKSWSEADFVRLLRSGKRPDGSPVNSAMPWRAAGRMSDEELHAVWLYLRSIPGVPTPGLKETASR